jgi:hypothetical protein
MPSTRSILITSAVALFAIIVVAYVQRNVMQVPVVGAYLPR